MADKVFTTTPKVVTTPREIVGAPPPQRVTIYDRNGAGMQVFQVDAREIVAGGEYSYNPPDVAPPAPIAPVIETAKPEPKPESASRVKSTGGK